MQQNFRAEGVAASLLHQWRAFGHDHGDWNSKFATVIRKRQSMVASTCGNHATLARFRIK